MLHTSILPSWAVPSCGNQRILSATYGAVSHLTGLDNILGGVGAPQAVHWMLVGGLADYQCRGKFTADQQLAMNMAAGYGGGIAATMLFG